LPEIHAEFFPFAGLNHTARWRNGRLLVRVSDIFTDAPQCVVEALAWILLGKLYRKTVDRSHHETYRGFILRDEIQARSLTARRTRGRAVGVLRTRGRHANLEACLERLHGQFFNDMEKPRITWSVRRTRCVLGRYDAARHTIFISRFLDSPDTPDYVLDYVVFHELLHAKHQSRIHNSRILVHTSEFRRDEKSFPAYGLAQHWLKAI